MTREKYRHIEIPSLLKREDWERSLTRYLPKLNSWRNTPEQQGEGDLETPTYAAQPGMDSFKREVKPSNVNRAKLPRDKVEVQVGAVFVMLDKIREAHAKVRWSRFNWNLCDPGTSTSQATVARLRLLAEAEHRDTVSNLIRVLRMMRDTLQVLTNLWRVEATVPREFRRHADEMTTEMTRFARLLERRSLYFVKVFTLLDFPTPQTTAPVKPATAPTPRAPAPTRPQHC